MMAGDRHLAPRLQARLVDVGGMHKHHHAAIGYAAITIILRIDGRVELIVRADNEAAIALYRKFGFELEGTLRRYIRAETDFQDALMMAKLY